MPLFELYRMTKEKLDSAKEKKNPTTTSTDLSLEPENDHLAELVMENGQILMQGQSSRTRKTATFNNFQSHCLPSHTAKTRDKYIGNGTNIKMGKLGTMDSMLNEIPMSVPSGGMGLNQDDDMVPWLNYPIDESLQSEYCSEFLPELSGVTANELSSQNNFASFGKRSSGNQFSRGFNSVHNDHLSLEQGSGSKISSVGGGEAARHKSSIRQLYPSSLQDSQTPFPYHRSRISDNNGTTMKNSTQHSVFWDSTTPTSAGNFPGLKMQKQDPKMPSNNSGLMNFSHFSRPAALVKANLQNFGLMMPGSNFSRTERMGTKDKGSVASSSNHVVESPLIDLSSGLRKETSSHCQTVVVPSKADVKPLETTKPSEELSASKLPRDICDEDAFKNDKNANQIPDESTNKGMPDVEKTIEPVVASSVCSGNSVERASDDPTHNLKRKHQDTEDSEYPSEDVEEESVGAKNIVLARVGSGSKRSRAAEVHNLSERRRRDRINEKMRSLQELIPNCNKVDKASMLDEAIEYLKTLQLQVQIMSMGAGLYMPPMMFPSGMQRMHAAHMAHFPPMGIGMGMGIGFGIGMPDMNGGSSGCPMVPVPQMHGAHFPGLPVSGPAALHGMAGSNFQLFGIPGQGHPISMPNAPLVPLSGGPIMKSSSMGLNACSVDMVGPVETLDSLATGSTLKDPMQNINSQVIRNAGANSSTNQTSNKSQATNESLAQPAALQDNCQVSEATGACTRNSPNKNDKVPNRADYKL
ncbi:hypothetical protein Dsin_000883 [Dipteronia sinensis]|uniref:BHLH domain-containing protein n=1 Tax=Dipteronia sinensis TaxID=43782 RepID=A0AAE0B425_9ROSI|nr:hypothetical protein Dsin_000883 [Dipteronia sinensis]